MKHFWIYVLCLAFLISGFVFFYPHSPAKQTSAPPLSSTESTLPPPEETPPFDSQISLLLEQGEVISEVSLDRYLVGVLLAELPTDFPMEALKAQAIASRTFALKRAEAGKHERSHVCSNPNCCQGFADEACFDTAAVSRIVQAVQETDGLVLTYEGELIDATFFSCSGGQTEAAVAVWGGDVAYLQSVQSPGEEEAPRFTETVSLDEAAFAKALLASFPEANLSGSPEAWFGATSYTLGGGINNIFIGGVPVSGTALRSLFSLRSTNISIEVQGQQISLTTRGFGHRVGLSQYGAKAMAETGKLFDEILLHYYQGTQIQKLSKDL